MLSRIQLAQLVHVHQYRATTLDLAIEDLVGIGRRQFVLPGPDLTHLIAPPALTRLLVGEVDCIPERRQCALGIVQDAAYPNLQDKIARLLESFYGVCPGCLHELQLLIPYAPA